AQLVRNAPPADLIAVTMTGELCDCFETKRQGVHAILDAVAEAAGPVSVLVWQADGRFVSPATARAAPLLAAAANWSALATFAGRYAPDDTALVIDVGSTTADLIPLSEGRPVPQGLTDPERLRSAELAYTGARRTPLCALVPGTAAEFFATTLDAYLVLGDLAEDADDRDTADGRPVTRAAAHARLARMLCADVETCTEEDTFQLALDARDRQADLLRRALGRVAGRLPEPPRTLILSGSGEFIVRRLLATFR